MAAGAPGPNPNAADWLVAVGTIATAALALMLATRDQLRSWLLQPRLRLKIKQGPPDCTTIEAKGVKIGPRGFAVPFQETQFYCRFSVDNEGRLRAVDVAVRLMRLWFLDGDAWTEDQSFFPMHLKWSHVGSTVTPALDPRLPRHCDFCHTSENEPYLFHLDTEVEPYEVAPDVFPTIKPAGTYRVEVGVTATNARAHYGIVELRGDGEWSDNAGEMATQHLVPTVIRQGNKPYENPAYTPSGRNLSRRPPRFWLPSDNQGAIASTIVDGVRADHPSRREGILRPIRSTHEPAILAKAA